MEATVADFTPKGPNRTAEAAAAAAECADEAAAPTGPTKPVPQPPIRRTHRNRLSTPGPSHARAPGPHTPTSRLVPVGRDPTTGGDLLLPVSTGLYSGETKAAHMRHALAHTTAHGAALAKIKGSLRINVGVTTLAQLSHVLTAHPRTPRVDIWTLIAVPSSPPFWLRASLFERDAELLRDAISHGLRGSSSLQVAEQLHRTDAAERFRDLRTLGPAVIAQYLGLNPFDGRHEYRFVIASRVEFTPPCDGLPVIELRAVLPSLVAAAGHDLLVDRKGRERGRVERLRKALDRMAVAFSPIASIAVARPRKKRVAEKVSVTPSRGYGGRKAPCGRKSNGEGAA
jgi:hypothetical protein